MSDNLPSPSQLLGAGNFTDWYPGQFDLFTKVLDWYYTSSRFLGMAIPTGSGKSLDALLLARTSGARTIVLTATKGLQSQYMKDITLLGGVSVTGQNNFPCLLVKSLTAAEGPCHDGMPCSIREQCPYRMQYKAALASNLVVTNYAYWLAQNNYSMGLGDVQLLIADECHQAFGALENFLTIVLHRLDVQSMGFAFLESPDSTWEMWKTWATASLPTAEEILAELDEQVKSYRADNMSVPNHVMRSYRTAKATTAKLHRLADIQEPWVIQKTYHGYKFVPVWVANYSSALFGSVPKVALMSAILSQRSVDYLGVPKGIENRAWVEADSLFSPQNTPIWHIPTARVNYLMDDFGTTIWASRVDQIIQRRLDRKGIMFTVSYERAKLLIERSRFKDIMLTHSTADVSMVVDKFKSMDAPAVLVSPSVTTGYDFPAELHNIKYIIVGKLPYPDSQDPVTSVRQKEDKSWSSFLAMETLIQECGRATRGPDDKVEVLIIDDSIKWFMPQYKHLAPRWFMQRWRGSKESVPDPLV